MSKVEETKAPDVPIVLGSIKELDCVIKAHVPIIQTITHDENKFIDEVFKNICEPRKMQLFIWSAWQGVVRYESDKTLLNPSRATGDWDKTWNPAAALEQIVKHNIPSTGEASKQFNGAIFMMRDFHTVLAQPIPRMLRDIYSHLLHENKIILLMGGSLSHGPGASKAGIEPTLEKQMVVYRYTLPNREEIDSQVRSLIKGVSSKKNLATEYTEDQYYAFSRALQGLTSIEVENTIAICITELKRLDVKRLLQEKKQIVMRSEILEYIESSNTLTDLGGMDELKMYIKTHSDSHSEDATAFGVDPLRGLLFLGIPGSGKSACAKAIGNTWEVPTLRLDIGKVMTGLVGGSEEKMRAALATAEAVAPCVLWLDEIEKALSGTKSSNFSDGGTLSRVFSTLLTQMEEGLPGVTLVATANDISALPPELIRRFSEVFFVGLPTLEERIEILDIHLRKKKRDPKKFDLTHLATISHRYTGAEIEKAIKEAIVSCYYDDKREVTTQDVANAIEATKPLSKVMADPIKAMEDWARERARFASSLLAKEQGIGNQRVTTKSGKTMNMAELDEEIPTAKKKSGKSRLNLSAEDTALDTKTVVETEVKDK